MKMNYQEAMESAYRGNRVSPVNMEFHVYYDKELQQFRKHTVSGFWRHEAEYLPDPYDKMRSWVLLDEKRLPQRIKKFITRALGKFSFGLSSNPA